MIKEIAKTDSEILECFNVMAELRSHLVRDEFVSSVRNQEIEGYRLAYIKNATGIVSVAGFRILSNLCFGKHLYIDDLVTAKAARSRSYGSLMIDWLSQIALDNSCVMINLDSGTHRGRAHKFYFMRGFTISDYHFYKSL